MKIPFFQTTITGNEAKSMEKVLQHGGAFMQSEFVDKCETWFNNHHGIKNFFLAKSCTQALELAAIVLEIKAGDEVILPSYAYVACANAFALRGATCVFVDVHPYTMNIDETKVEKAITPKTKAIVTLNYAGVACNYKALNELKHKHNLYLVEDNAHGTCSKYDDRFLGTFGDLSTFSFDHMKNINCGQGGGIGVNNENLLEKFFVHYDSGTNRRSFLRKETANYEWVNLGSNYRVSELNAAMLYSQLNDEALIRERYGNYWNRYSELFKQLEDSGSIKTPHLCEKQQHNSYCFFIKVASGAQRNSLLQFLNQKGVAAQFHYIPLHSSKFGSKNGRFEGDDNFTTLESEKIVRLPLYYNMTPADVDYVADAVYAFYNKN